MVAKVQPAAFREITDCRLAMKKIYLKVRKRTHNDTEFVKLTALAGRIARLLGSKPPIKTPLQACLDDLLGAVYSLMYAKHYKFDTRPQPLGQKDIQSVLVRARRMALSKLRTEGKWTAGFYFNNALFRTSAVYHRSLKILTGNEESNNKGLKVLGPCADKLYQEARKIPWANESVRRVHCEVNGLKHTSSGISSGRDVPFETAVRAVAEILEIIEALK
jgi:hypothetical protein